MSLPTKKQRQQLSKDNPFAGMDTPDVSVSEDNPFKGLASPGEKKNLGVNDLQSDVNIPSVSLNSGSEDLVSGVNAVVPSTEPEKSFTQTLRDAFKSGSGINFEAKASTGNLTPTDVERKCLLII